MAITRTSDLDINNQSAIADSELGRLLGTIFSTTSSSAINTMTNNIMKGQALTQGLGQNVGTSLAGAGVGIASNYIGLGITSALGNNYTGRALGAGVSTGLGTVGGKVAGNLITSGKIGNLFSGAGSIYGLAASVVGSALNAGNGPSKEYAGRYGSTTRTMDTVYDGLTLAVNAIPGWGQLASGLMTLNKGLSNVFGSTDGMTLTDAILGSAFMPAPIKWLNVAGAKTTSNFNNLSWQNMEKANSFMGNAFGNLGERFGDARVEAGKTYGRFSKSAYREAQNNIDFANRAWGLIMLMANLNEIQNIRALDMSSINNQRYTLNILGGWSPIARGKQGMKIFNNATNHNIGMRLLSAAALIDNKQMILSAQGGTKVTRPPRMRAHRKGDESKGLTPEEQEWWRQHEEEQKRQLEEETAKKIKEKEEATDKFNQQASTVMGAMIQQANETPFTGLEYQQAADNLRQEKVEKFHEAEKIGEAALMADLGVNVAAPLLLRGFRWMFNKAGLLVKVPMLKTSYSIGLPGYPHYYNPTTNQWDFSSAASDVKQGIDNLRKWMNNPIYRKAAEANKAEAEAMGLTYIPYYERPEYIRALENPNIKFKNLNSSVGGESNLSGEVTINTGTTLNPTLVVRHEMGHVAGLGKISESAAINPDNTLLLKELKYLRHKSNQVYKEGSEYAGQVDLNRNSFEGIQNARDFGEELGIKIGQEYPGYEKALEIVNSYPENGFKAGLKKMFRLDKEHMPYVWKALAGTLFTLAAILYNTNK